MPSITALLHTHNDAMRLGRCLETLYPCDEIMIIDHESTDATVHIGREYGAKIIPSEMRGQPPPAVLRSKAPLPRYKTPETLTPDSTWILCLDPRESISESLAASLFELKSQPAEASQPYSVFLREETAEGWLQHPTAQTRLVPQTWNDWREWNDGNGNLSQAASALVLEGELLRFVFP
jgi:glycosyltransferase involved in cell wall biosynthesis